MHAQARVPLAAAVGVCSDRVAASPDVPAAAPGRQRSEGGGRLSPRFDEQLCTRRGAVVGMPVRRAGLRVRRVGLSPGCAQEVKDTSPTSCRPSLDPCSPDGTAAGGARPTAALGSSGDTQYQARCLGGDPVCSLDLTRACEILSLP